MRNVSVLFVGAVFTAFSLSVQAVAFRPAATEIVTGEQPSAVVRFAARELKAFCEGALGGEVPVVDRPTSGRAAIHLGMNEWMAAGFPTNRFTRDALAIREKDGAVYVAGIDDEKADSFHAVATGGIWSQLYERGTIFGVYEFAERFLGVRMYFPGELGTVIPKAPQVEVPVGTDILLAPTFLDRSVSTHSGGAWFEPIPEPKNPYMKSRRDWPLKNLQSYRLRLETFNRPCCHGSNGFRYLERFRDSHPEYFALLGNGKRGFDPSAGHVGQLCWSSGLMEEMYLDVKTCLLGGDAQSRGLKRWGYNTRGGKMVDVMPQDGYQRCHCEKCTRAYTDERHYATDLIWGQVANLANRLRAENVPGEVMMMAYTPYRRVPQVELPPNVQVMVAETGPWAVADPVEWKRENEEVAAWVKKLGHKVWLWNYANKYGTLKIDDVPSSTPRAVSRYYKSVLPHVTGAYMESECDRYLYNYLNYYVFSRVAWHPEEDVEAILAEHHRLMFGAAAPEMAKFFDALERCWAERVAGDTIETPLGPVGKVPGDYALWTEVYSPALLTQLDQWLAAAAAKCAPDSVERRRIALFRREYFRPLAEKARRYLASISVTAAQADRAAHPERRNFVVNGDFTQPRAATGRHYGVFEKGKWKGGWITDLKETNCVSLAQEAPAGLSRSLKLSCAQPTRVNVTQYFRGQGTQMVPGRRYRISFFVKLENVAPAGSDGGFGARVWHDRNVWFPDHRLTGSTDWIHQEYFFTAGPGADKCENTLTFLLWNATGSVYVTGVLLEELGPAAK